MVVIEPNGSVLRAIARLLGTIDGIELVSALSSAPPAREFESLSPELLILHMSLAPLARPVGGSRLILLTIHDGTELREAARCSPADAVLCTARLHEDLPAVIQRLFVLKER